MADIALLVILKRSIAANNGMQEWNQWRKDNLIRKPDLGGAILYSSNLNGANFSDTHLAMATLTEANLVKTDLSRANLSGADLSGADLSGAHLIGADLSRANLTGTILFSTIINRANLTDADLSQARFHGTLLTNLDLRGIHGLDTALHSGPSSLSIDTLYQSHGEIPDVFLRGCGLSDELISFVHAIAGPLQYYKVFISYNHQDNAFVERLHNDLQANGVRCWKYTEDMPIGGDIYQTVYDKIVRIYDKVLVVLSQDSIQSDWVKDEVEMGIEKEKQTGKAVLFPIRVDDVYRTTTQAWAGRIRRRLNVGDFTCWKDPGAYQVALKRLLRDLKTDVAAPALDEAGSPTMTA